jgi:HSP20 family protein
MAEVNVVKETKPVRKETSPGLELEFPFFRGSLFGMSPFGLMRQFTDEMDRFFKHGGKISPEIELWQPVIEVKEQGGKLSVTAELPGLKEQDVKVSVADNVLTLEGERKQEKEEKREGYYHSERSYGRFSRSIGLPEGANIDQATAQFNNGVLEVAVPIPERKPSRKEIPVQAQGKTKSMAG